MAGSVRGILLGLMMTGATDIGWSQQSEHWPPLPLPKIACRGTEHCGRFVEDNPGWPCHMPTLFITAKNPDVAWQSVADHMAWAADPLHSYVADGTGALTVIAHPGRWQEELLATLPGLTGMEICHGGDFSKVSGGRWDRALRARLAKGLGAIWGFAADDTHSSRKADRSWLAVRLAKLTERDLKAALRSGAFYASTGPAIADVQVAGGTITVKLAQRSDVQWLKSGQYSTPTRHGIARAAVSIDPGRDRCVKLDEAVTESSYTLNAADGTADPANAMFVRCIVTAGDRAAMSQPFVVRSAKAVANPYPATGTWYKGMTHNHSDAMPGSTDAIGRYHANYAAKGHACAFETGYDYWLTPLQLFPPNRTPIVDRVEPMRLVVGKAATVTVHGRAFAEGAEVLIDGKAVRAAKRLSAGRIELTLPGRLKVGPHTVTVRNRDGLQGTRQYAVVVQESAKVNDGWTHFMPANSSLGSRHVYAVAGDADGGVWVATNYGLNHFDGKQWRLWRRKPDGLIADTIYDLAVADGAVWFTCFRGMGLLSGGELKQWRALDEKLPSKQINQIVRVGGVTYVSTHNRSGLFALRRGKWQRVAIGIGGPRPPKIHGLAADGRGRIWMGSNAGLLRWEPAKGDAGWKAYTTANSPLPDDYVYRLAFDPAGRLWIATATRSEKPVGGLICLDGDKWTTWTPANSPLPERRVWSVFVDRDGNVWAATGRGVACLTAGGTWHVFTTTNSGLADNMVTDIGQDTRGHMWFATANGVSRFAAKVE